MARRFRTENQLTPDHLTTLLTLAHINGLIWLTSTGLYVTAPLSSGWTGQSAERQHVIAACACRLELTGLHD